VAQPDVAARRRGGLDPTGSPGRGLKRGVGEVSAGKVYRLGHPYTADMPLFGARKFIIRIPGSPTDGPFGANKLVYNDEFVANRDRPGPARQFDGLGHIGVQIGNDGDKANMRFYTASRWPRSATRPGSRSSASRS